MPENGIVHKLRIVRELTETLEGLALMEGDKHEWREVQGVIDVAIEALKQEGSVQEGRPARRMDA